MVYARFTQPDTMVPSPDDPQSLNRYSYAGNNPLRYTDPSGHLTEDELRTLLGDYHDALIALWKKYDTYFLAMLRDIEGGDSLTASLLGGIELHFEGSGADIRAAVYGQGQYSNKLWDWQGQGVYSIRKPGMTEQQVQHERDKLFSEYADDGRMRQPVFDYGLEYGDIQYLGAQVLGPGVDWQVTSVSGEVFGEWGRALGPVAELWGIGKTISFSVGLMVTLGDIAAGTLWKSLTSPRTYALVPYTTLDRNLMPVDMTYSPLVPLTDLRR